MDDDKPNNRERKLAGRDKTRRFGSSGRSFLHALTNSRVRRQEETVEKAERSEGDLRPDEQDGAQG